MAKINDYNTRLKIQHNWNIYKIWMIWYTSDYGYNIQDFSCFDEQNYIASKIKIQWWWQWNIKSIKLNPEHTYNVSVSKPKISHHFDWKSHISWHNITSWYFEDGSSKGLSIKSFDLLSKNDWWPIFVFNIWSNAIEKFKIEKQITEKKKQLIFNWDEIDDCRKEKNDIFDYVLEWYYIPKRDFERNEKTAKSIEIQHPSYGTIEAYPVAFPLEIPWIIFIYINKSDTHDEGNHFSITWVPGLKDSNGDWEVLSLTANQWEENIYQSLNRDIKKED